MRQAHLDAEDITTRLAPEGSLAQPKTGQDVSGAQAPVM